MARGEPSSVAAPDRPPTCLRAHYRSVNIRRCRSVMRFKQSLALSGQKKYCHGHIACHATSTKTPAMRGLSERRGSRGSTDAQRAPVDMFTCPQLYHSCACLRFNCKSHASVVPLQVCGQPPSHERVGFCKMAIWRLYSIDELGNVCPGALPYTMAMMSDMPALVFLPPDLAGHLACNQPGVLPPGLDQAVPCPFLLPMLSLGHPTQGARLASETTVPTRGSI